MSLKLRRNYTTILLLLAILCFLSGVMGDQRIMAYTLDDQHATNLAAAAMGAVSGAARSAGTAGVAAIDAGYRLLHVAAAFKASPPAGPGQQ